MPSNNKNTVTLHIPYPNEKQRLFLESKVKYTAFGGARGSHMLSMFEYRADENLGEHLDLSDAEYHTEESEEKEEVAAK